MRLGPFALLAVLAAALVAGLVAAGGIAGPAGAVRRPSPDPVTVARKYLQDGAHAQGAGSDNPELVLVGFRESLAGRHVHFQQTVDGLPLFGTYVTVNLGKDDDDVTLVTDRASPNLRRVVSAVNVTGTQAVAVARRVVGIRGAFRGPTTVEAVYFATGDSLALRSWQVLLPAVDPLGDWLVVVSAKDGTVLHTANLMAFDHPDSAGQVFDPNPVVSSASAIPPPIDCDSPENEALLSGEYFSRELRGINAEQGQLVGAYVDLTAPGIEGAYKPAGQADEPSHVYVYGCDDDRFEEVMIYYHVDRVQRLIQSLGFTGESAIRADSLPAHPHYSDDDELGCRAFYSIVNGGYIVFPDGCKLFGTQLAADRGEDADVIVHEYGHALQDDQVLGSWWSTREGAGMAEGFADFLTAAVSADPCMFEWLTAVGTQLLGIECSPAFKDPDLGPFRNLVNDLHFPEDVNDVDPHVTGLIWGGALWDLVQSLGGDQAARMKVLTIVLQSHFYLNQTANFAEGFAAIRQADIDLESGEHLVAIDAAFNARGIFVASFGDANCVGGVNSIDALLVLQFDAGLIAWLACGQIADVNGDGSVNSLDAVLILQFDAGLLDELPPLPTCIEYVEASGLFLCTSFAPTPTTEAPIAVPTATEPAVVDATATVEPADGGPEESTVADVSLAEFAVEPSVDTVPAGSVTFNVSNEGTIVHNLRVIRTDLEPDALPVDDATFTVDEGQVEVVAHSEDLAAGASEAVTAALQPGSFVLICNIPAHYDAGMYTAFSVE